MAARSVWEQKGSGKGKRKADYYAGVSDAAAMGAAMAVEGKYERKVRAREQQAAFVAVRNARVGGIVGSELKAYDDAGLHIPLYGLAGAAADNGSLCAPLLTNALDGRTGNKITMKSILVEGVLQIPNANGVAFNAINSGSITIAVVLDKQTNGVGIVPSNVYDNVSEPFNRRVLENSARYTVLAKKVFPVTPSAMVVDGVGTCTVKYPAQQVTLQKKMNQQACFVQTAPGGTVADIKSGSLSLLCFWSDSNGITLGQPTFNWTSRVRYVD